MEPKWIIPFLEAVEACGRIGLACKKVGIDNSLPYVHNDRHPDQNLKARIEAAEKKGLEALVDRYYLWAMTDEKCAWNIIRTKHPEFKDKVDLSGTVERVYRIVHVDKKGSNEKG